jgi:tetratricopeptide (TPR) repeat protein
MKQRVTHPGWLWRSLLALTVIQTLSSAALVYGRKVETAERVQFLRDKVETPLVVPSQSQVADLAPLWSEAEMFTAASPSALRRFIADARRVGTDAFWLLLPRSGEVESMKKIPGVMRLDEEYEFETGLLWKTPWWLGRFEDVGDSVAWGAFYDELARREIAAGRLQRALPEHESATQFAPSEADYHYNYAVTLGKLGYFAEAESELRSAVAADSTHREAKELLGKIMARSSSSP